jgi:hypothetical protein
VKASRKITTGGQRAIAAAEAWIMAEKEGKKLAGRGGDQGGSKAKAQNGG